jgi:hypothetical protein
MMDEDCVERIYKDAEDLFLSVKLRKGNKVSLDEVIAEIGEHVVEDADSTEIIRKMRDRRIRRICKPYSIAGPHRNRVCCFPIVRHAESRSRPDISRPEFRILWRRIFDGAVD